MKNIRITLLSFFIICSLFFLLNGAAYSQEAAPPVSAPAAEPAAVPAVEPSLPPAATPTTAPAASGAATTTTDKKEGDKKQEKDKTFWELLQDGGIVMYPLGLISVLMVGLLIDSFMRLRNVKLAPLDLVQFLREQFQKGDYAGAYQACKSRVSFLANVVRVGLSMLGQGKEATEMAMEEVLAKEVSSLSTRIYYLSLIGVITPMLGLTGTVLGMIKAFKKLGTSGISDPSGLAGAIGEVLTATATGLFLAIPGFAFYYFFRNRIASTTAHAEDVINGLFRGMPYEELDGVVIGDEPVYAASPNPNLLATKRVDQKGQVVAVRAKTGQTEVPRVKVSQPIEQVFQCPSCQHPVTTSNHACPNCNTPLSWNTQQEHAGAR